MKSHRRSPLSPLSVANVAVGGASVLFASALLALAGPSASYADEPTNASGANDAGAQATDGGPRVVRLREAPPPQKTKAKPKDLADFVVSNTQPDPKPFVTGLYAVVDLKFDHGDAYLLGTRSLSVAPMETPRMMGRFALELHEGPALIERVRFDFPLMGAPLDAGRIDQNIVTRVGVKFPRIDKGNRFELVDRASGRRWQLPWPLES